MTNKNTLPEEITENGIHYPLHGDYYFPDLAAPETDSRPAHREMGPDAPGLPEGTQTGAVQPPDLVRQAVSSIGRAERSGSGPVGNDHPADATQRGCG